MELRKIQRESVCVPGRERRRGRERKQRVEESVIKEDLEKGRK